jgi:hypothetical protein
VITEFILVHIREPRTSGCNFYLCICDLSIKCHWKPNHHHADMARLMSKDAYVFLSPEFFLLRNYIHECFQTQIFLVNNY